MTCKKCGSALPAGALFCPECGGKVEAEHQLVETKVNVEGAPKKNVLGIVAASLAFVLSFIGLTQLADDASWIFDEFNIIMVGFALYYLLQIAGFILIGIGILKENKMTLVGFGLNVVSAFCYFVVGFFDNQYFVHTYYSYNSYREGFNLLASFPALWEVLAFAVVAAVVAVGCVPALAKYKEQVAKLWFVPGIAVISVPVVALLVRVMVLGFDGGNWASYRYFMINFLQILVQLMIAAIAIYVGMKANGKVEAKLSELKTSGTTTVQAGTAPQSNNATAAAPAASTVAPVVHPNGYIEMVKHILLLIFTFGIWNFIWVYKTTDYLNCVEGEEYKSPTTQLLLCMFVPFYVIYWTYLYAKRIDKLGAQRGVESDITLICLLFAVFFYLLAPIFMQDKLNNIVKPVAKPAYVQTQGTTVAATPAPAVVVEVKAPAQEPVAPVANDVVAELKGYKDLLDSGIITQEEFDAKKKELLGL